MLEGPRKLIYELKKILEDLRCDPMMDAMPSGQQELFAALELLSSRKRWHGCSRNVPTCLGTVTKIKSFSSIMHQSGRGGNPSKLVGRKWGCCGS